MATLVLGAVGSALGAGFGGTILGFSGAAIGGFIGSTIGSVVDNWIVGSLMPNQRIEGARLESLRVTSSTEGTAIPRIFGRMRVGGNLIWATDFTETFRTEEQGGGKGGGGGNFEDSDDPYDQAVSIVLRDGKASTSYIQRRLGVGYNKAASIIEKMEKEGIVGPANHAGKREILVPVEEEY